MDVMEDIYNESFVGNGGAVDCFENYFGYLLWSMVRFLTGKKFFEHSGRS